MLSLEHRNPQPHEHGLSDARTHIYGPQKSVPEIPSIDRPTDRSIDAHTSMPPPAAIVSVFTRTSFSYDGAVLFPCLLALRAAALSFHLRPASCQRTRDWKQVHRGVGTVFLGVRRPGWGLISPISGHAPVSDFQKSGGAPAPGPGRFSLAP